MQNTWLIHDIKHHKHNSLQTLELPYKYPTLNTNLN